MNRFGRMPLRTKLRDVYPERDWKRIEEDGSQITSALRRPRPTSLVRLGDGELRVLKKGDELSEMLARAVRGASLLGLPDHYEGMTRSHAFKWDRKLVSTLKGRYGIGVDARRVVSSYVFLYSPQLTGQLVSDKRVLWITGNAKNIVRNLGSEAFRAYYDLHSIKHNDFIEVPEARGPLPSTPYKRVLDDFDSEIASKRDYDIALVGAGVLGKVYCDIIRSRYAKHAVDVGCLMSAYKGLRNRVVFRVGEDLDFLVWNDETSAGLENRL